MGTLLRFEDAIDIGFGRGRAAADPAASIRRIDAQLARPADVNEAWRSPEQANANYARWVAYQNGTGPKAPLALPADRSVHCIGYAADSDDWYSPVAAQVWRDNGWRQTARYPGTSRDEPWHGEYSRSNDKFYGQPAFAGGTPFDAEEAELMGAIQDIQAMHDVTRRVVADAVQQMHDVTRSHVVGESQKQHDVTRGFTVGQAQAMHDVTRRYLADTITASVAKLYPGASLEQIRQAVTDAVGTAPALSDAQVHELGAQLTASAVAGIDAALRDDFDGVKARIAQLPEETIAALKAAL